MKRIVKLITICLFVCCTFFQVIESHAATTNELLLNNTRTPFVMGSAKEPASIKMVVPSEGCVDLYVASWLDEVTMEIYTDTSESPFYTEVVSTVRSEEAIGRWYPMNLPAGTYYIKVAPCSADLVDVKMYIRAAFESITTSDLEPNNDFANAMTLKCETEVLSMHSYFDDTDFYLVEVGKCGQLNLVVDSDNSSLDVEIYSADQQFVKSLAFSGYMKSSCLVDLPQGMYYVKVTSRSPLRSWYTLTCQSQNVEKLTLSASYVELDCKTGKYLNAEVAPSNAINPVVEWTSSDDSVVSVDEDGFVYGKKAGVAVVTVATTDGSNLSQQCTVVVVPNKVQYVMDDTFFTKQKSIGLEWGEVEGADGYRVYKYNASKKKYVKYKDTKKPWVTVKKLSPEKGYKFKVAAYVNYNSKKIFGKSSAVCKCYTKPKSIGRTSITSIRSYKTEGAYNYIEVKWKKVKGATGYYVYGKAPGEKYKYIMTTKSCAAKLVAGRGYVYSIKVKAYRKKHNLSTEGKYSVAKSYRSY